MLTTLGAWVLIPTPLFLYEIPCACTFVHHMHKRRQKQYKNKQIMSCFVNAYKTGKTYEQLLKPNILEAGKLQLIMIIHLDTL